MTPVEFITVGISALAIVTRIVMFVRGASSGTPSGRAPRDLWIAEYPHLHH